MSLHFFCNKDATSYIEVNYELYVIKSYNQHYEPVITVASMAIRQLLRIAKGVSLMRASTLHHPLIYRLWFGFPCR